MTAEHTPGPWTFDDVWHLVKGPKGEEVAAIHSAQADDTALRNNHNTVHANAQLISAAPDLLEALQDMLASYAPNAQTSAEKEGEQSLHSAVRASTRSSF